MFSNYIKDSHKRCKHLKKAPPLVLNLQEVTIQKDLYSEIELITRRCIEKNKSSFFALHNSFFTLTSKELIVINSFVNKNSNIDMSKYVPQNGTSLKEEHYGITAVSLSDYKKDTSYIIGKEHFRSESKNLTCVAVPIKHHDFQGYLSLSSYNNNSVNGLRAFIESLSQNIQYELKRRKAIKRLNSCVEDLSNRILEKDSFALSQKEKEIIHYILKGFSNIQIAKQLCIAETTVKTHLKNIYNKSGTRNKTDTALFILCKELLDNID